MVRTRPIAHSTSCVDHPQLNELSPSSDGLLGQRPSTLPLRSAVDPDCRSDARELWLSGELVHRALVE
jgi:hypothetical protein